MSDTTKRLRRSVAARLRRAAAHLDPPTEPYGEWDRRLGCLVIKYPNGAGSSLPIARVDIGPGMVSDTQTPRHWEPKL